MVNQIQWQTQVQIPASSWVLLRSFEPPIRWKGVPTEIGKVFICQCHIREVEAEEFKNKMKMYNLLSAAGPMRSHVNMSDQSCDGAIILWLHNFTSADRALWQPKDGTNIIYFSGARAPRPSGIKISLIWILFYGIWRVDCFFFFLFQARVPSMQRISLQTTLKSS